MEANAEAQLIDAEIQGRYGDEKNNLHGQVNGKVLSANANGYVGSDGLEAKAEAVGASAGLDLGASIIGINFDADASIGYQVGGGVAFGERGVEVDAKFIFGGKIKITW